MSFSWLQVGISKAEEGGKGKECSGRGASKGKEKAKKDDKDGNRVSKEWSI